MQWIIILGDSQVGEKIIRNLRSPATRPRFCAVRKGGTIASVRVISGGAASRLIASSRRSARGRFRRSGPGFNCSPRSIVSWVTGRILWWGPCVFRQGCCEREAEGIGFGIRWISSCLWGCLVLTSCARISNVEEVQSNQKAGIFSIAANVPLPYWAVDSQEWCPTFQWFSDTPAISISPHLLSWPPST